MSSACTAVVFLGMPLTGTLAASFGAALAGLVSGAAEGAGSVMRAKVARPLRFAPLLCSPRAPRATVVVGQPRTVNDPVMPAHLALESPRGSPTWARLALRPVLEHRVRRRRYGRGLLTRRRPRTLILGQVLRHGRLEVLEELAWRLRRQVVGPRHAAKRSATVPGQAKAPACLHSTGGQTSEGNVADRIPFMRRP